MKTVRSTWGYPMGRSGCGSRHVDRWPLGQDRRPSSPGPGLGLIIDGQNPVPLLGDGLVVSRMSATARLPALNSSTRPPAAKSEAGNPPM